MASYYPEGECFFLRSSLVYATHWRAQNERQFYSHVLIEYYWNGWVTRNGNPVTHSRSRLITGKAQGIQVGKPTFGLWDKFFVGESVERDVSTMLAITSHPNSDNFNECRDRDNGGPLKYILRPIEIRDKRTQWLWIDGTVPLRAIYFPVSYQADDAFRTYCTYVVIDLRARETVDISDTSGNFRTFRSSRTHGLDYVRDTTWGFNVPNIITYLTLPRQIRNPEQGLYRTTKRGDELFVRAASSRSWWCPQPTLHARDFHRQMDLAAIISASFGVEVGWRPYQYSSFIANLLQRAVGFALGFVPGVGPLLSVGFGIAMQAITNPGAFSVDNVLDLGEAVLQIVIDSAGRGRKYVAPDVLPPTAAAKELTEDERKARKEAGEALNAYLTKIILQTEGQDPPQSRAWLERIADGATPVQIAEEDAEQTAEDSEPTAEDAEQTTEDAEQTADGAEKTAGDAGDAAQTAGGTEKTGDHADK